MAEAGCHTCIVLLYYQGKSRIQEVQCGFRPGHGTVNQLYTLNRVLEGAWEFAQPIYMCFVDLETVSLGEPCGGCSGSMECP